ncbi:DUF1631 domain-containing protein [Spongiibacter sp. KMU-166]|uniref:DUF1631 domain-containing protein n=1 Tax=Spongiibacter thalassae TaxID=2721624 RepID=A0ABX1GK61_9GAMM|nr:DUF1631 domain-containing protein [Spongiibacter thalassae]NKI18863.1 DUF1631 domain-containing protein [Spongiibacter thalassae]
MTDKGSKIVGFDKAAPQGEAPSTANLPAELKALCEKSRLYLSERLTVLLDEVDDRLFELADEASNAKEQHIYFDSMREIRVHRQHIEARFVEVLSDGFSPRGLRGRSSPQDRGEAKLKLLESDALEELVAIEGMAKKAERKFLQELWLLCTAWQHCVGGEVIAAADLPIGPASIAQALGEASRLLDIDIKARLVLLKLFDSELVGRFGEMFELLVPVLEAQGLSIDMLNRKRGPRPQVESEPEPAPVQPGDSSSAPAQARAGEAPSGASARTQTTVLVSQLIDALENIVNNGVGGAEPKALSKPSFMVALQDMQNEQYAHFLNRRAANDETGHIEDIAEKLIGRLQQVNKVGAGDASALSAERDRDTISFVGSLFEYILEGDVLSEHLKALLAQLQIPILKIALLDKGFFSHEEHPARKLLSSIMGAGIGWSPNGAVKKDPLYKKLEEVVIRVLGDFAVDTQVFVDALQDFSKFQRRAMQRAELLAQRAESAEGGRATAETARAYVAGVLDDKLASGNYPAVVHKILKDGWSKVLFISYVQAGPDSARFRDETELVDRLLWSVAPNNESGHRNELIEALPVLTETLRLGFNRVSLNIFETGQWFEQLERLHMAKLTRKSRGQPSTENRARVLDLDDLDAAVAEKFDRISEAEEGRTAHSLPLSGDTEESRSAAKPREMASGLANLRVGNWVDLTVADGKMQRCRLAAVINGIGKYIFVDRAGIKVCEHDLRSLTAALESGDLVLIDDDRLFDRALESVISNLRDMRNKPTN